MLEAGDSQEAAAWGCIHDIDLAKLIPAGVHTNPPAFPPEQQADNNLLLQAPWAQTFPQQIKGLVLQQKRPPMPGEAKHGISGLIQSCWQHKPSKRPAMPDVVAELLQVRCPKPCLALHVGGWWRASNAARVDTKSGLALAAGCSPVLSSEDLRSR